MSVTFSVVKKKKKRKTNNPPPKKKKNSGYFNIGGTGQIRSSMGRYKAAKLLSEPLPFKDLHLGKTDPLLYQIKNLRGSQ